MEKSSLSVNPVSMISAGAFMGLGFGAMCKPQRPSLKTLLSKNQQYFDETFYPEIQQNMSQEENSALKNLLQGRDTYRKSGSSEDKSIKRAAKAWAEKFNKIEVDTDLTQRLSNKKTFLRKAVEENGLTNIAKNLRIVKKNLQATPDSVTLREQFIELSNQNSKIRKLLEFPIDEYKEALAAVKKERLKRMKTLPHSGLEVKTLYKNMQQAMGRKRTLMSNKLYELANNHELKESYKALKHFLPEYRLGNALRGAAAFGTLTAAWLIFFNPSTRK